ncbi:zinc finger protein 236-like [Uranotaenia lowii]|uniref:zinc finger protein 236-like n=1 Tax=Uranotaenia lowii TaxID=190385 RepID=UPI00247AE44C|nr:zinc finger protein 236-like [Uranotaenia lowii]
MNQSNEHIKAEQDFYFPNTAGSQEADEDLQFGHDQQDQVELHQINLDSPVKSMLVPNEVSGKPPKIKSCYDACNEDQAAVEDDCDSLKDDEASSSSSSSSTSVVGGSGVHECDVCGKRVVSAAYLVRHKKIHTGTKPFECKICGKAFIRQFTLTVHYRIHTGEKPHQCPCCDQRFNQSCNLLSHIRRYHPEEQTSISRMSSSSGSNSAMAPRSASASLFTEQSPFQESRGQPFQCCVCDEPFFDRELLVIHEETHVPEAPFECRYCTTMYSTLPNFRSHVNLHKMNQRRQTPTPTVAAPTPRSSQSGIRINPSGPVAVRRSLPTASPSTVNTSSDNNVLNANQLFIASGNSEHPYKCVECHKNFQKHELYFHMRVHLKQKNIFSGKDYRCDQCGKVFEKDITLQKHKLTAHQSAPIVSSATGGPEGSVLIEALKTDARSLSPSATKSGKVQSSPERIVTEPEVKIKLEPESAIADDEVNSTVSDNPILTQLLNTNSNGAESAGSRQSTPTLGESNFVISAVASVDPNFLKQLDEMERGNQDELEPQEDEPPETIEDDEEDDLLEPLQQMPPLKRMPMLEESLRRAPVASVPQQTPIFNHFAYGNGSSATKVYTGPAGPYQCVYCSKVFNEHFGLRQHIRSKHWSERRFKCKECNKKFTLGISLATHMRVHTSVQPFTCIVCFKTFTRSASLNGHLSSHSHVKVKCAECSEVQHSVFNYMKHIEKSHPNFLNNVTSYRKKADAILKRRRELVLEITRDLAKYKAEIPNVLARLREQNLASIASNNEVSSSQQVKVKKEPADSAQSEEVSSSVGKSNMDALPALRAELRKRPLRSNTKTDDLEDINLPPARKARISGAGDSSPNLKRLLESPPLGGNDDNHQWTRGTAEVKSEPSK